MALKAELIQWNNGCLAFEAKDYYAAIEEFEQVADSSKLHFNLAVSFLNVRQVDEAINCLTRAIACDVYLAVAYFQRGVCFYSKNMLSEALADLTDALAFLRGNLVIDYTQLGLPYKLYACEVSFNRGLCFAAVGQLDAAMADFEDAIRTRPLDGAGDADHRRMDEALELQDRSPDYLHPYDVPATVIYKPPPGKLKNVEKKDYLGKSKVVAAFDAEDGFAGFSGTKIKAQSLATDSTKNPTEMENNFSRTATLNVRKTNAAANAPNGEPAFGLDGSPLTFAALNKRAISATTTNAPVSLPETPADFNPSRRPSAPTSFSPRNSSIRLPSKSKTITPGTRPLSPPDRDTRIEDEVDEMMRYAAAAAASKTLPRSTPSSRRPSYDDINRRPITPPMSDEYPRYDDRRNTATSFATTTTSTASDRLKIKCHWNDTRIVVAVPTNIAFEELHMRVSKKFGMGRGMRIKYRDMDGEMVMMTDQEDMEVAFEMAGVEVGVPGGSVGNGCDRFEVWCFE